MISLNMQLCRYFICTIQNPITSIPDTCITKQIVEVTCRWWYNENIWVTTRYMYLVDTDPLQIHQHSHIQMPLQDFCRFHHWSNEGVQHSSRSLHMEQTTLTITGLALGQFPFPVAKGYLYLNQKWVCWAMKRLFVKWFNNTEFGSKESKQDTHVVHVSICWSSC